MPISNERFETPEFAAGMISELEYVVNTPAAYAEAMMGEIEQIHRERFQGGTEFGIDPPSYTAIANGYPSMNRSGRLARSLGWGNAGRSADSIRELRGDTLVFGTARPGMAIHARGGTLTAAPGKFFIFKIGDRWFKKKSVKIPKRRFLGLFGNLERARVAVVLVRVAVERMIGKQSDFGTEKVTTHGTSSREMTNSYYKGE